MIVQYYKSFLGQINLIYVHLRLILIAFALSPFHESFFTTYIKIIEIRLMNKKRILITGGAGFIGSHLIAHLLQQNWEVSVLDNCCVGNKIDLGLLPKINFIQADIRNLEAVIEASKNCDAIVHLAALVGVDEVIAQPLDTIEIEVMGTQNVGKAARINGIKKIIYTSSSAVYKNTLHEKSKEDDPFYLVNDYAVAKRLNEVYLKSLSTETAISTNSLRLFNVYGLRQDTRMVIPRFFENAYSGKPIQVFGDGQQTRDFTHISEVLLAIEKLLARQDVSGVFNVARGHEINILQLAKIIKTVTGSDSPIELLDFPEKRLSYKVNKRIGSTDKLWEAIGFRPSISVEEGLKQLVIQLQKKSIIHSAI